MNYSPTTAGLAQARRELTGRLVSCCLPLTCCDLQAKVASVELRNGELVATLEVETAEGWIAYKAGLKDITI